VTKPNPDQAASPGQPAGGTADGMRVREAARVVLLDPDDRVLLMRYDDDPPNNVHWSTPGGGLNPGESHPHAAIRELAEETGWTDIVLLGEIHRRSHVMTYANLPVRQHERLYLARTDQPARPITGVEEMHASDGIAAWRWWTVAELEATTEKIWPAGLAGLVRAAARRDRADAAGD
jgi:8-oxo-dGTP pyrophosphatase MutT (NUDIX family)